MNNRLNIGIGIIITAVVCFFKFYTLGDYNIIRHSHLDYVRGEAYLNYFLTGNKDYSNIPESERCYFQTTTFAEAISTDFKALHYNKNLTGPSGSLLSSLGCTIFKRKLGLLGEIDAHNSMFVILTSLTVFVVFLFSLRIYGVWIASISSIFLALFPRFVGHAQNNYRELPLFCFGTFAIWAFWKGVTKKDWKLIVLSSVFWGLALANKLTALYIPGIMLTWWIFLIWRDRKWVNKSLWITFALYPVIAVLIIFAVFPYLWYDSINHISTIIEWHHSQGMDPNIGWRPYYVPFYTLITTPVPIIILGVIGLWVAIKRLKDEDDKISLITISWFLVPLLSFTIPRIAVRSGIRHFMFFIPGLCILAGIGARTLYDFTVKSLTRLNRQIAVPTGVAIQLLIILSLLYSVVQTHPYQVTYFNSLIGGLYGAKTIKIPFVPSKPGLPGATDYWGNPYNAPYMTGIPYAYDELFNSHRRAFRWLNENGEQNSLVLVWVGAYQTYWKSSQSYNLPGLRKDFTALELKATKTIGQAKRTKLEHCYVVFCPDMVLLTGWSVIVQYCFKNLKPVYYEESQGAPVFLVYKLY